MMSLRSRRDPQYSGNRALKPVRILNKGGDGNVGSVNMPEKSARYMKDFVHTLVRHLIKSQGEAQTSSLFFSLSCHRWKHNGAGLS